MISLHFYHFDDDNLTKNENDKIINDNLIIDSSSKNNENIKIKDLNWNKITNKRESIHHVKLNERQKIVPIDKLEEKLFSKSKKA